MKKNSCLVILILLVSFAHTDIYSGSHPTEAKILRAPVWVFLETQPGIIGSASYTAHLPPRQAITEVSQFIIAGMVYGWKFSYTPYDKTRQIPEEFTLTPIHRIQNTDNRLSITELRPKYPFLYCWAEYRMNETIAQRRKHWASAQYVTVQGIGQAARQDEIQGIYTAYQQAALSAIRTYLRKIEKNKPKYVTGELLIKDNPRLGISSGYYTAELSLYMNIEEIVRYTVF